MQEKRYQIKKGVQVCALDSFAEAGTEELRLLCALLSLGGEAGAEECAALAGLSAEEGAAAFAFWRGAGAVSLCRTAKKAEAAEAKAAEEAPAKAAAGAEALASGEKPVRPADKLPTYTPGELAGVVERENLSSFIKTCQQIHGKELSGADIAILVGLHEHLALENEYICLLLAYCNEGGEDKPKKPIRYAEKVAFSLFDAGIRTPGALAEYIEKKHFIASQEGKLRKMLGIGERDLTRKEEALFEKWLCEYGYDMELIGLAYDITVNATGKAAPNYMDKIISGWNTAGCKNASDAKALLEKEKAARTFPSGMRKKDGGLSPGAKEEKEKMRSFDVDDFFSHALSRSYGDAADERAKKEKP